MTKAQAIHEFWSSFGIPAYDEQSVPDDATMPYITYEASFGNFENEVPLTASVYYRSTSWESISHKCDEISAILHSLSPIRIDRGRLRLWEGDTPLFQRMDDTSDDMLKRVVVNVMAEFMTSY